MNIDELTIKQVKELANLFVAGQAPLPFKVGDTMLIRTVTHYFTGRIKEVVGAFLVLEQAAWIADTGRFYNCLKTGALNEVEPIPGLCRVNTAAIIDAIDWPHELPSEQK